MLKPLHNRILVERVDAEAKTASGIIIPDSAKEKPQEGKVIAVGPGNKDKQGNVIPMDVKKGDRILFAKFGGSEVKIDGKDYLIMKEDDVMGIVG
jgi:chaperonin GroES